MFDRARSTRCSPDDRLGEVAAILVAGLLWLGQPAALPGRKLPENPPKEPSEGLELPDETVLSLRVG